MVLLRNRNRLPVIVRQNRDPRWATEMRRTVLLSVIAELPYMYVHRNANSVCTQSRVHDPAWFWSYRCGFDIVDDYYCWYHTRVSVLRHDQLVSLENTLLFSGVLPVQRGLSLYIGVQFAFTEVIMYIVACFLHVEMTIIVLI